MLPVRQFTIYAILFASFFRFPNRLSDFCFLSYLFGSSQFVSILKSAEVGIRTFAAIFTTISNIACFFSSVENMRTHVRFISVLILGWGAVG